MATVGILVLTLWNWGVPGSADATSSDPSAKPPALASNCLTHRPVCYTPKAIQAAYGIRELLAHGIDGRGVTVVLPETAEAAPTNPPAVTDIRQDLADFDRQFGLPPAQIKVITTLAGSSASLWLARLEEVQDTELVHVIAPDATIDELLVNPSDYGTPATAATTFAALVRLGSQHER